MKLANLLQLTKQLHPAPLAAIRPYIHRVSVTDAHFGRRDFAFSSYSTAMPTFVIEDEVHAEQHGEFGTFDDALGELRRRAKIPWDREPNLAPCTNWKACGRRYEIVEYDCDETPWRELQRVPALEISANGINWPLSPPTHSTKPAG